MNFMQHQQTYGGVGQHHVPQTTAVGSHTYSHGSNPAGPINGPPPLAQPPGPPPLGSGGIRLGPSPGLPLQNNGQIPQVTIKMWYKIGDKVIMHFYQNGLDYNLYFLF